jgi:hypothetical protein
VAVESPLTGGGIKRDPNQNHFSNQEHWQVLVQSTNQIVHLLKARLLTPDPTPFRDLLIPEF